MSLSHDIPLATSLGHCLYVLGSIQGTGEKLLLQYNTIRGKAEQDTHKDGPKMCWHTFGKMTWWWWCFVCSLLDSWSELLPTLTRADANLPAPYFLGATDRLFVIGGNNAETVVTSFCLQSKRWGQVQQQETIKYGWFAKASLMFMPNIQKQTAASHPVALGAYHWEGDVCRSGDNWRWPGPSDAKHRTQHHCRVGSPNSLYQSSSSSAHLHLLWSNFSPSLLILKWAASRHSACLSMFSVWMW